MKSAEAAKIDKVRQKELNDGKYVKKLDVA